MKHVLLPIDGSTRSLRTIDMVQQTYRPQDTEVTLLMVLPDQMHIDGQFARDRMARKAAQELETFAALLPGWTVRTELLWGSPGCHTYSGINFFQLVYQCFLADILHAYIEG